MDPKHTIQLGISDIQLETSNEISSREKFFDNFKEKYPNIHAIYVTINIIAIWTGTGVIAEMWSQGESFFTSAAPDFSLAVTTHHLALFIFSILMLLVDDFSLGELVLMRKTPMKKSVEEMNAREKFFYNFKNQYPNLSSIYAMIAIVICWCSIGGLLLDIPVQPFWRSVVEIGVGFFLLYIDDLKLNEI